MTHSSVPPDRRSEKAALTRSLIASLERKLQLLDEDLRPLVSEYRAVQAALVVLRKDLTSLSPGDEEGSVAFELSDDLVRKLKVRTRELLPERAPRSNAVSASEKGATLRPGSLPAHAREVLRAAGEPLHIDEIHERMQIGGVPANRDSLVTALARLASAGHIFFRIGEEANTFALREWLPSKGDTKLSPRRQTGKGK